MELITIAKQMRIKSSVFLCNLIRNYAVMSSTVT